MPPETSNPFTILSSTVVFENPKIALVNHHVANPGGGEQDYGVLHFKEAGIRILPIDQEGHTLLVGQYRFGAGYYSWELPAGGALARGSAEIGRRPGARGGGRRRGALLAPALPLRGLGIRDR